MDISREQIITLVAEENPEAAAVVKEMAISHLKRQIEVVEKQGVAKHLHILNWDAHTGCYTIEKAIEQKLDKEVFSGYDVKAAMFRQVERRIDGLKEYAKKESDPDMKKMYRGDAKDMEKVLNLMRKGEWKEASNIAHHMDTSARENIPDLAWEVMESKADGRSI